MSNLKFKDQITSGNFSGNGNFGKRITSDSCNGNDNCRPTNLPLSCNGNSHCTQTTPGILIFFNFENLNFTQNCKTSFLYIYNPKFIRFEYQYKYICHTSW